MEESANPDSSIERSGMTMNKAELANAITALTGEAVNPDSYTRTELEQMLADVQVTPPGEPPGTVRVRLGPDAPVGALIVGPVRIERELAGDISIADYERLKDEYQLVTE